MVAGSAPENGPGQSKDAQFGDFQAIRWVRVKIFLKTKVIETNSFRLLRLNRCRVETAERGPEEAVHRRGQEIEVSWEFFVVVAVVVWKNGFLSGGETRALFVYR